MENSLYLPINFCAMTAAILSPSIAALTIPPAYPAPSAQGYKFFNWGWHKRFVSLGILTGLEVRLSVATTTASFVKYPGLPGRPAIFFPNALNPPASAE
jgi:hypothetical protein